jgi:hypothetical protein
MIFLAKYIYVFELNFCTLSCNIKIHILCINHEFGLTKIFILDLCMFPLKNDELRSVEFLGEYAGSLGLFRTREHA